MIINNRINEATTTQKMPMGVSPELLEEEKTDVLRLDDVVPDV